MQHVGTPAHEHKGQITPSWCQEVNNFTHSLCSKLVNYYGLLRGAGGTFALMTLNDLNLMLPGMDSKKQQQK